MGRKRRTHCFRCAEKLDSNDKTYCRSCKNEISKEHYRANKQQVVNRNLQRREWLRKYVQRVKCRGCVVCGYKRCVWSIDFHHIDETTKIFNIGDWPHLGYSLTRLKEELRKCARLCSNCHGEVHAEMIKLTYPAKSWARVSIRHK